jgi:hypothetical protein
MPRRALTVAAVVAVVALAGIAWRVWRPSEERVIRSRLESLVSDFNETTTDGLGTLAHAVALASYFTEDVQIDLGPGSTPIEGRQALVGAGAALQPRTASLRVGLEDVGVTIDPSRTSATVTLTASVTRRSFTTREESIDAREFALALTKADGTWRIARVTPVDTLR